jgi:hypothetical protein
MTDWAEYRLALQLRTDGDVQAAGNHRTVAYWDHDCLGLG